MSTSKKRSRVWNYFGEHAPNIAKCGFCLKILSYKGGATGNLIRHLKVMHDIKIHDEEEFPKYSEESISPSFIFNSTAIEDIPESITEQEDEFVSETTKRKSPLPSSNRKPLSDRRNEDIHKSLVKLLVKNYLPIQLVDNDDFRAFVNQLNICYKIPSRKIVAKTLIPQLHNMVKEEIRSSLDSATACCLTIDGWTSCTNSNYISVTAHYITTNSELNSSLLDCYEYFEGYTAENLCTEIKRITHDWNIENKIVAVTSDNTPNILAAIKLCKWKHVPCFARTLNLIVQSALLNVADLQNKIKMIGEFFKRNPEANEHLKEMQLQMGKPVLSLKQDHATSWNSTVDMFSRILEVKEPLMIVLSVNYPKLPNINNNDILIIESICNILKIFKDVSSEMSNEKQVTASKVILLGNALKSFCNNYFEANKNCPVEVMEFGKKLLDNLNKGFSLVGETNIFAEATILDPRFKRHGFKSESAFEKAKELIIAQISTMITQEEDPNEVDASTTQSQDDNKGKMNDIWGDFDKKVHGSVQRNNPKDEAIIEVNKFIDEPVLLRKDNPLEWWNQRCHTYPHLFQLAKEKLCVVATSVPSVRIFSKAGQIITKSRNGLSGKHVSEIIFLNANL